MATSQIGTKSKPMPIKDLVFNQIKKCSFLRGRLILVMGPFGKWFFEKAEKMSRIIVA
jgi:hypothetical protein